MNLTQFEQRVLEAVKGHTLEEAARELSMTVAGVKYHLTKIRKKGYEVSPKVYQVIYPHRLDLHKGITQQANSVG